MASQVPTRLAEIRAHVDATISTWKRFYPGTTDSRRAAASRRCAGGNEGEEVVDAVISTERLTKSHCKG
jgi:hypothetical protein